MISKNELKNKWLELSNQNNKLNYNTIDDFYRNKEKLITSIPEEYRNYLEPLIYGYFDADDNKFKLKIKTPLKKIVNALVDIEKLAMLPNFSDVLCKILDNIDSQDKALNLTLDLYSQEVFDSKSIINSAKTDAISYFQKYNQDGLINETILHFKNIDNFYVKASGINTEEYNKQFIVPINNIIKWNDIFIVYTKNLKLIDAKHTYYSEDDNLIELVYIQITPKIIEYEDEQKEFIKKYVNLYTSMKKSSINFSNQEIRQVADIYEDERLLEFVKEGV